MKWLLRIVAALAGIVVVVTVVGMMLPQNHVAARSAHLSVPPEKVWNIITDAQAYPSWRSDVASVQILSTGQGRLSWREVSPKGNKLSYDATTLDAPSHFVAVIADKDIPLAGAGIIGSLRMETEAE